MAAIRCAPQATSVGVLNIVPNSHDPARAAHQLLIASLEHGSTEAYSSVFKEKMPSAIEALHLEDPERVDRALSTPLFISLLECIQQPLLQIGLSDFFVRSSFVSHLLSNERAVGQTMPLFCQFCRVLCTEFGVPERYWLQYYIFACSSMLHAPSARAVLAGFSLRPDEQVDAMLKWMRDSDAILFGDEESEEERLKWQPRYKAEWQILGGFVRFILPHYAPDATLVVATPVPPQTPPAHRDAPSVAPQTPRETVEVEDIDKEKEEEEDGEEEEEKEEEEAPGVAKSEAQLVPSIESIAHKCGKHRGGCKKERLRHELLSEFCYRYGLPATIDADQLYRLALIRLFASSPARRALVGHYWEHPEQITRRLDQAHVSTRLERHCTPSLWHSFLAPFDSIDGSFSSHTDLLDVHRFNDAVNRAAPTGHRASAASVCIKRFLTAHKGGSTHWRPLWDHAFGEPSQEMEAAINAYLASHPTADPSTLAHILYLVPKPEEV